MLQSVTMKKRVIVIVTVNYSYHSNLFVMYYNDDIIYQSSYPTYQLLPAIFFAAKPPFGKPAFQKPKGEPYPNEAILVELMLGRFKLSK